MLVSIYLMTLELSLNIVLGRKRLDFAIYTRSCYGRHFMMLPKSVNH